MNENEKCLERWRRREGRRKNKIWSRDGTITGEGCKKKKGEKENKKRETKEIRKRNRGVGGASAE